MKIIPLRTTEANAFISQFHRHNGPIDHRSHRFTLGLQNVTGDLIGVAVAGLPIARNLDDGKTLEILRVCVKEGNKNANSMLYGRLSRIAFLMGYEKVITYTLQKECASSLKAVGAVLEAELNKPNSWDRSSRHRGEKAVYSEKKYRWCFKKPKEAGV
jgi:hypothetical protein